MHYYRYRSNSELSFKELLYDELYFCSPEECNDPFDGKAFYQFQNSPDVWRRFVSMALNQFQIPSAIPPAEIEAVATALANSCPLPYSEIETDAFFERLMSELQTLDSIRLSIVIYAIRKMISLYKPRSMNFVSFSRQNNSILMWSHYAANHKGFCLIFKSIDGSLAQCSSRKRARISRKTPSGIAPQMSNSIPATFHFKEVEYVEKVESLDAFICFPAAISEISLTEKETHELADRQIKQLSQKHIGWEYEQESRLILHEPLSWLFGENIGYSRNERLMHYEPTQLVGIVYGCRTTATDKERLAEIIQDRMERISLKPNPKIIFDFIVHQAELSRDSREVQIHPIEIFSLSSRINVKDKNFSDRYEKWLAGEGLKFEGNGASRITIPG